VITSPDEIGLLADAEVGFATTDEVQRFFRNGGNDDGDIHAFITEKSMLLGDDEGKMIRI